MAEAFSIHDHAAASAHTLAEFLDKHPEWGSVQYQPYATFCNSFILHRR